MATKKLTTRQREKALKAIEKRYDASIYAAERAFKNAYDKSDAVQKAQLGRASIAHNKARERLG